MAESRLLRLRLRLRLAGGDGSGNGGMGTGYGVRGTASASVSAAATGAVATATARRPRRVGELDAIERSWFATGFWLDSPVVADPLLRVNKWNQDGLWWGEMAGDGDSHHSLTKQVFVYKQTAQKRHPGGTLLRATPPERPME